jgi:outer membrane protein assembly factor BamB
VETVEKVNGFMVALNLADGKLLWRSDYFGEQSHSSPALSEDGQLVFAGANNHYFFALRADTGELAWKADLNGEIKGTPMVYGGRVFISSWDGSLVALR